MVENNFFLNTLLAVFAQIILFSVFGYIALNNLFANELFLTTDSQNPILKKIQVQEDPSLTSTKIELDKLRTLSKDKKEIIKKLEVLNLNYE